jgi:hypothetical protein
MGNFDVVAPFKTSSQWQIVLLDSGKNTDILIFQHMMAQAISKVTHFFIKFLDHIDMFYAYSIIINDEVKQSVSNFRCHRHVLYMLHILPV